MDERGFFYIVDRVKDMISIGGIKVFPAEVERVLRDHSAVGEAAVVGVPDEILGEKVAAFVVRNEMPDGSDHDDSGLEPELLNFCPGRLADFKIPQRIIFLDELPRNPSGKILKTQLRQLDLSKFGLTSRQYSEEVDSPGCLYMLVTGR